VSPFQRAGQPPPPPRSYFTFNDQWTVLSDGTIAILHEREYRIDWLNADASPGGSARLPFPWIALDDAAKKQVADSINADQTAAEIRGNARRDSMRTGRLPNPSGLPTSPLAPLPRTDASVMPDFYPPVVHDRPMVGDADNNVWIRVTEHPPVAGSLYDVVNRRDGLVARFRLPEDWTLVGFGPGHQVYLMEQDVGNAVLERVAW
jgi:hypothetical protein